MHLFQYRDPDPSFQGQFHDVPDEKEAKRLIASGDYVPTEGHDGLSLPPVVSGKNYVKAPSKTAPKKKPAPEKGTYDRKDMRTKK